MAAYYYDRGMTLIDAIDELYKKYGFYSEETVNLFMYGVDGLGEMRTLMASLRQTPPARPFSDGLLFPANPLFLLFRIK